MLFAKTATWASYVTVIGQKACSIIVYKGGYIKLVVTHETVTAAIYSDLGVCSGCNLILGYLHKRLKFLMTILLQI